MHKKDKHLMYPLQCDCMYSSDEEEEGAYEFSPPQDVNNIPWIINNSRRWSDYVYHTNCIHKFANLMNNVEGFNLPVADRKRIIYCLAEDVLYIHGVDAFFGKTGCNCEIDY